MPAPLREATFFLALLASAPAFADADRLDALFAMLAQETVEAEPIQQEIASLWAQSGSDSFDLLLRRGRMAMAHGAAQKALDHLGALTRLAPDFAEGWNALATAQFQADDYWSSVASIQKTLALEPRHYGALSGLAMVLEQTGDKQGALAALRAALAVNPHLDEVRARAERLADEVDGRDI